MGFRPGHPRSTQLDPELIVSLLTFTDLDPASGESALVDVVKGSAVATEEPLRSVAATIVCYSGEHSLVRGGRR
ncbi:hypothetical protein AW168_19050 [Nocardia brasiliensis]|nr:hypothetical protein AW168_19050 [Nocardia brasiliensis]